MATVNSNSGKGTSSKATKGSSAATPAQLVTVVQQPTAPTQTQAPAAPVAPANGTPTVQAPTLAQGTVAPQAQPGLPVVVTGKGTQQPPAKPGSKLAATQAVAPSKVQCVGKWRTHNTLKPGTYNHAAAMLLLQHLQANGCTGPSTARTCAQLAKAISWPVNPARKVQNAGYNARHAAANLHAAGLVVQLGSGTGGTAYVYITPAGQQLLAPPVAATQAS